jgi:hypothetical protein
VFCGDENECPVSPHVEAPTEDEAIAAWHARQPAQSDALLIANERKAIAAWLRGEVDTDYTDPEYDIGRNLADAVERGAYIQEQSKFKFTLNGEESVLAVDDGVTMRVGSVSPSMRLTVGTLAPPLIAFMNQQNNEPVMTIHPDGKITLGEKADPTEAAAACIEAMSGMIQDMIKNAVLREQSK